MPRKKRLPITPELERCIVWANRLVEMKQELPPRSRLRKRYETEIAREVRIAYRHIQRAKEAQDQRSELQKLQPVEFVLDQAAAPAPEPHLRLVVTNPP